MCRIITCRHFNLDTTRTHTQTFQPSERNRRIRYDLHWDVLNDESQDTVWPAPTCTQRRPLENGWKSVYRTARTQHFRQTIVKKNCTITSPGYTVIVMMMIKMYLLWREIRSAKQNLNALASTPSPPPHRHPLAHTPEHIYRNLCSQVRKPVWPSGKALGWQAEGPQFESTSAHLSLQKLWSADAVLWRCPSQIMKQSNISHRCPCQCRSHSGDDSVEIGIYSSLFPHLHTPFHPFSPSLISLMVSVDIKHHVSLSCSQEWST